MLRQYPSSHGCQPCADEEHVQCAAVPGGIRLTCGMPGVGETGLRFAAAAGWYLPAACSVARTRSALRNQCQHRGFLTWPAGKPLRMSKKQGERQPARVEVSGQSRKGHARKRESRRSSPVHMHGITCAHARDRYRWRANAWPACWGAGGLCCMDWCLNTLLSLPRVLKGEWEQQVLQIDAGATMDWR